MLRSTTPFDKCQTAVFVFMDNGAKSKEQGARSKEQRLKCVRLMWQAKLIGLLSIVLVPLSNSESR